MRNNERRSDVLSAAKFQEIRNMMTAFGSTAAKRFGESDFLDPDLVKAALSFRHDRRQRLRRSMDRPEGAAPIPPYK
jgi:hypothetical protein